jgi:rod shape-determining protein MreB
MAKAQTKQQEVSASRVSAPKASSTPEPAVNSTASPATSTLVGFDLGTNNTVIVAAENGKTLPLDPDIITSVVGYPKPGIIPGILPSDAEVLFGNEAINYRLHLDLKWPLNEGFVQDIDVCRVFTEHLRTMIDPSGKKKLWGVVGAPANASPQRQKDVRSTMVGLLERLLIVPEPFLAAMGLREDPGFKKDGNSADPTKHSLIVDVGAGTTDLCLVRGYYPTADDQISFSKAGTYIDEMLYQAICRRYPDVKLTRVTVTQIKESHSFVEGHERDAQVRVYVDGRPQLLDFTDIIREACDALTPFILKGIKELLSRCDSDSIVDVMQNIILTGGGSEIHGLCEKLEHALKTEGYDCAKVVRPADYQHLVARGAVKVAGNVRDDQWQVPM